MWTIGVLRLDSGIHRDVGALIRGGELARSHPGTPSHPDSETSGSLGVGTAGFPMAQGQGLDVATPLVRQRREIFCVFSLRFLTEMHTFLEPKKLLDRSLPELPRVDLYGPRSEPISDPVGP